MRVIQRGDRGDTVRDVQGRLTALGFAIDRSELEEDRFEESTENAVRAFQQRRGLLVDGLVGGETWGELVEAGYGLGDRVLYLRFPYFRGDDVRILQHRLNVLGFDPGREDGIFGEQTSRAVEDFQRNVGLGPDGIVGGTTVEALERLPAMVEGPGRTGVRETELLRQRGSLAGRTIAVEAGHGPSDPGAEGPGGMVEAHATLLIARALADELRHRGADPVLLRDLGEDPSIEERISRANDSGADALISVHLNSHRDAGAEGASCYYFGREETVSVAGRALAELIQEQLTGLGLKDGRTHPKAFPLLRETGMAAVHVEPCFITNPREARLLGEPGFAPELARAMAEALEGFFAGRADDPGSPNEAPARSTP